MEFASSDDSRMVVVSQLVLACLTCIKGQQWQDVWTSLLTSSHSSSVGGDARRYHFEKSNTPYWLPPHHSVILCFLGQNGNKHNMYNNAWERLGQRTIYIYRE